eukprot:jgi/Tetstr1/439476/TSEL_027908.t1
MPAAHRLDYTSSPKSHPVPGSPLSYPNSPKHMQGQSPSKPPSVSRMIAVAPFCPPQMRRLESWTLKDYALVKEIGAGAASVVYHAFCRKSAIPVALKIYKKRKLGILNMRQVEREIQIHIQIQHANVVDLYGAFEDESRIYLVMQYAAGGDLFDELRRLGGRMSEQETVCTVLVPFLRAMSHLHERGIVHRDIKPENTLFDQNRILKIADFGLSINSIEERPVTRLGTLDYMAPEVLVCPDKKHPDENKGNVSLAYGGEVDAWGVGVLTYELLIGRPPFAMAVRDSTMDAIMTKDPRFPSWMSEGAKDFVRRALEKNPAVRPTVPGMLRHPWILSLCGPPRAVVQVCWNNGAEAPKGMIPAQQVSAQRVVNAAMARSSAQEMEDSRRTREGSTPKKGQSPQQQSVAVLVGDQRPPQFGGGPALKHAHSMDTLHSSFGSLSMYPQNDSPPVSKTPSRHAAKVPEGWKPSAVSGSPQAASQRHVAGEAARGPAPGGQKDESRGGASFAKTIKKQLRGKNFLSSFRDLSKKGRGAASPHTQQQHKKPLLEEQRADAVGHTARKSLKEKDAAMRASLNLANLQRKEAAAMESQQIEAATGRLLAGRTDAVVHIRSSGDCRPSQLSHARLQQQPQQQPRSPGGWPTMGREMGGIAAYHPLARAERGTLQLREETSWGG